MGRTEKWKRTRRTDSLGSGIYIVCVDSSVQHNSILSGFIVSFVCWHSWRIYIFKERAVISQSHIIIISPLLDSYKLLSMKLCSNESSNSCRVFSLVLSVSAPKHRVDKKSHELCCIWLFRSLSTHPTALKYAVKWA